MTLRFKAESREESRLLAGSLAPFLEPGDVLALQGGLGAGKTAFAADLAEALGFAPELVSSPTFTIVQEYLPEAEETPPIYHFDVYRLADAEAFLELGLDEYFYRGGICILEWAENVREALPEDRLDLSIELAEPLVSEADFDAEGPLVLAEDTRARFYTFKAGGPLSASRLAAWQASAAFPEALSAGLPREGESC